MSNKSRYAWVDDILEHHVHSNASRTAAAPKFRTVLCMPAQQLPQQQPLCAQTTIAHPEHLLPLPATSSASLTVSTCCPCLPPALPHSAAPGWCSRCGCSSACWAAQHTARTQMTPADHPSAAGSHPSSLCTALYQCNRTYCRASRIQCCGLWSLFYGVMYSKATAVLLQLLCELPCPGRLLQLWSCYVCVMQYQPADVRTVFTMACIPRGFCHKRT
jgi:hypothetical protein